MSVFMNIVWTKRAVCFVFVLSLTVSHFKPSLRIMPIRAQVLQSAINQSDSLVSAVHADALELTYTTVLNAVSSNQNSINYAWSFRIRMLTS